MNWNDHRAILTSDPGFTDLAWPEVERANGRKLTYKSLAPGVRLVGLTPTFWELAESWRRRPPIFVRHIAPAQLTVPHPTPAALQQVVQQNYVDLIDPSLLFSVQTRVFGLDAKPYDINTTLAELIQQQTSAVLDVRRPQQILSVALAQTGHEPVAYLGLSPAVYNLSDWAGGERRYKRLSTLISRAEFKLLEALEVFRIQLPPRGTALDLGAAPGGWSRVLREKEQYVTAVDPADLHPSLAGDSGLRHKKMTAEAYLAAGPDRYDLIVNDMRLDARDSARLMVAYASFLSTDGQAIMTLKLPEEKRENVLDHSFNILKRAYTIASGRQLFHNRSEITVHLRPAS